MSACKLTLESVLITFCKNILVDKNVLQHNALQLHYNQFIMPDYINVELGPVPMLKYLLYFLLAVL